MESPYELKCMPMTCNMDIIFVYDFSSNGRCYAKNQYILKNDLGGSLMVCIVVLLVGLESHYPASFRRLPIIGGLPKAYLSQFASSSIPGSKMTESAQVKH